jgi:UDP-glucose 4-epimerase
MRVLVTGGAGFIGSHLVDRLVARGDGVTVIDDLSNGSLDNLPLSQIAFKRRDISQPLPVMGGFDVIYHLACHPRSRSFTEPRRDVDVNLRGMVNMLEYARAVGARVVFSSNSGIYDSAIQPIREGNPEKPTTPYDVTKLASEHMIKAYSEAYGIPYTIFRFATVYGTRQSVTSEWSPVIANFVKTINRGRTPYITGDGKQTRDFIYVSDIVDALLLGVEVKERQVGALLLGSGVETSIMDAFYTVCRVLGKTSKYERRPAPLGEIKRMSYDCSLARSILGWAPRVSLSEGVALLRDYEPLTAGAGKNFVK